jgi:hypothetical protein
MQRWARMIPQWDRVEAGDPAGTTEEAGLPAGVGGTTAGVGTSIVADATDATSSECRVTPGAAGPPEDPEPKRGREPHSAGLSVAKSSSL